MASNDAGINDSVNKDIVIALHANSHLIGAQAILATDQFEDYETCTRTGQLTKGVPPESTIKPAPNIPPLLTCSCFEALVPGFLIRLIVNTHHSPSLVPFKTWCLLEVTCLSIQLFEVCPMFNLYVVEWINDNRLRDGSGDTSKKQENWLNGVVRPDGSGVIGLIVRLVVMIAGFERPLRFMRSFPSELLNHVSVQRTIVPVYKFVVTL